MKIGLFAFCCNLSFPFEKQYFLMKKYVIDDDWEYILLNDGINAEMRNSIEKKCEEHHIKMVNIPQEIHYHATYNSPPSMAYGESLDWLIYSDLAKNYDIIGCLHTDVYPIHPVSVSSIIGDKKIATTIETRPYEGGNIIYIYPAFTFIKIKELSEIGELSFGICKVEKNNKIINLDTGGKSYELYEKNPEFFKLLSNHQLNNISPSYYENLTTRKCFELELKWCRKYKMRFGWLCEGFYHYIAGSMWDKVRLIKEYKNSNDIEIAANKIKSWWKNIKNKNYYKCHLRRMSLLELL